MKVPGDIHTVQCFVLGCSGI